MTGVSFDNPIWLHLMWVVGVVVAIGIYGMRQRRLGMQRFADVALWPRLVPATNRAAAFLRLGLIGASLALLAVALANPRWGGEPRSVFRRNVDVFVLLDVSRSMLADDLAPNRLERARLALRDDLVGALSGEHVGLITFAGDALLACPLTNDYGALRLALDDVTVRSVERGGTLIGDAIRAASDAFQTKLDTHKLVILVTDGEDHESFAVEAAAAAWEEQQISTIAVALGDPQRGARIPVNTQTGQHYVQHDGQDVWSKADFESLRRIVSVSEQGVLIPAGTGDFDLGAVYRQLVRAIRFEETTEQRQTHRPLRYHAFALAALVLVLLDSAGASPWRGAGSLRSRAPGGCSQSTAGAGSGRYSRGWLAHALRGWGNGALVCVLLAMLPIVLGAERGDPRKLVERGNTHFAAGQFVDALALYEQAVYAGHVPDQLHHNRAAALFKLGRYDEAREIWLRIRDQADAAFEARMIYNLANCDYAEAIGLAESDPRRAVDLLHRATVHYLDALCVDPSLDDARANLELAQRLIRQIDTQLEPPPEPADGQSPQEHDKPATQPSESPDQQPQQQESDDQSEPDDPSSKPPPTADRPEPDAPPSETEAEPIDEQGEIVDETRMRMTPELAERLLQIVRDAEKARREELAQRRPSRRQPAARDW